MSRLLTISFSINLKFLGDIKAKTSLHFTTLSPVEVRVGELAPVESVSSFFSICAYLAIILPYLDSRAANCRCLAP